MAQKKLSFEQSLARLDEIVRHLEKGDMPYGCNSVIFDDGTLENLTMGQAKLYTVLLIAIPAVLAAVGIFVMIRRKNR